MTSPHSFSLLLLHPFCHHSLFNGCFSIEYKGGTQLYYVKPPVSLNLTERYPLLWPKSANCHRVAKPLLKDEPPKRLNRRLRRERLRPLRRVLLHSQSVSNVLCPQRSRMERVFPPSSRRSRCPSIRKITSLYPKGNELGSMMTHD